MSCFVIRIRAHGSMTVEVFGRGEAAFAVERDRTITGIGGYKR